MLLIFSLSFLFGVSAIFGEPVVNCPAPRSPDHGQSFVYQDGRVVKYACEPGYMLLGKEIVRCLNGQWEEMPSCIQIDGAELGFEAPVATAEPAEPVPRRPLFNWGGEESNSTDEEPLQGDDARIRRVIYPNRRRVRVVTSRLRAASELEDEEKKRAGQRTTIHLQAPPSVVYVRRTVSPGKSINQERTLNEQYRTAAVHMTVEDNGEDQVQVVALPRQPVAQNDKGEENLRHMYWLAQNYYPRSASVVDYRSGYPMGMTLSESQLAWINSLHPELRDQYLRDLYVVRRDEAAEGARSQAFLRRYEDVYNLYHTPLYLTNAATYLTHDVTALYDYTCNQAGHHFVTAPKLPNAHIARYDRRQNPNAPHNNYLTAVYQCNPGYTMLDTRFTELHCSKRRWIGGADPVCVPRA